MKFLYTSVLTLLLMAPAVLAGAQTSTTRTASGGADEQSAATGVDLDIRNELEVINERVEVVEDEINVTETRVENIIRRVNTLRPVITRTRYVTVTERVSCGGGGSSGGGGGGGNTHTHTHTNIHVGAPPRHEGAGSCFIAGTKVRMADGSLKNIEEVQIGEVVRGQDGAHNRVVAYDRPNLGTRQLYAINDDHHFVTEEHPFMTTEGWKSINPAATARENPNLKVGKLEVGDVLVTYQAQNQEVAVAQASPELKGLVEIKSITKADDDDNMTVYNFILDGNNTYFAGDYLVHNKGGCL